MPPRWPAGGCPGHPVLGPSCHGPWRSLARPTLLREDALTLGSLLHRRAHTHLDAVAWLSVPHVHNRTPLPGPGVSHRGTGKAPTRRIEMGTPKSPALTGELFRVHTSAGRPGASRLLRAGTGAGAAAGPTHNLVPVGAGEEGVLVVAPQEPVGRRKVPRGPQRPDLRPDHARAFLARGTAPHARSRPVSLFSSQGMRSQNTGQTSRQPRPGQRLAEGGRCGSAKLTKEPVASTCPWRPGMGPKTSWAVSGGGLCGHTTGQRALPGQSHGPELARLDFLAKRRGALCGQ